jgi:hypothetical protein
LREKDRFQFEEYMTDAAKEVIDRIEAEEKAAHRAKKGVVEEEVN